MYITPFSSIGGKKVLISILPHLLGEDRLQIIGVEAELRVGSCGGQGGQVRRAQTDGTGFQGHRAGLLGEWRLGGTG